jgi:dihydroxyacid dehydratase/phosphogluconate dehydratase
MYVDVSSSMNVRSATNACPLGYQMPACFMAAVRHNRPTIIIYGGTIQPGNRHLDCPSLGKKSGDPISLGDTFESFGALTIGQVSDAEHEDVIRHACPGAGACGGEQRVAVTRKLQTADQ